MDAAELRRGCSALKSANSLPDQPERERGLRVKSHLSVPLATTIPARKVAVARALNIRSAPQTRWTAWARRMLAQRGLRKTEKSYLPLRDQITDRVGHLLDRHVGIDAVLIRQVDIVGAKPAQGALHRLTNLLRPSVTIGADLLVALETETVSANTSSHHCRIGYSARLGFPNSISWCAPLLITVRVSLTTYIGRSPT